MGVGRSDERAVGDSRHLLHAGSPAALTRIDRVCLPPDSPHRNLIERGWKCVKKTALANRPIADDPAFKAVIGDTLDRLGTTCLDAMTSHHFETLHPASTPSA